MRLAQNVDCKYGQDYISIIERHREAGCDTRRNAGGSDFERLRTLPAPAGPITITPYLLMTGWSREDDEKRRARCRIARWTTRGKLHESCDKMPH